MDRSGMRLLMRGLALVAALFAVCAFHGSASEPPGVSVAAAPVPDLVGPLHVDLNEVPAAVPDEGQHAHPVVVILLGGLLLAFAVRPLAYALGDLWRTAARAGVSDRPRCTTPSLTRLCVLRT
ncbi:hypothetical protein ACXJJ3_02815 [Kribbella sp. WER1]